MVFSQHFSNNRSRFSELSRMRQPKLPHGKKYPAVNRLHSVPNIGKCPRDNDAHRVGKIRFLHFGGDFSRFYIANLHIPMPMMRINANPRIANFEKTFQEVRDSPVSHLSADSHRHYGKLGISVSFWSLPASCSLSSVF